MPEQPWWIITGAFQISEVNRSRTAASWAWNQAAELSEASEAIGDDKAGDGKDADVLK